MTETSYSVPVTESQQPEIRHKAEGMKFGKRAAAYAIDLVAFYVVNQVFATIVGVFIGLGLLILGIDLIVDLEQLEFLDRLFGIPLLILYFTIFETLYGATAGKLILRMRVVGASGEPVGLGAALLRGVLRLLDGLVFGLVAYSNMKEPLNQRFGDKKAKTIVVDLRNSFIVRPRPFWTFAIAFAVYLLAFLFITLIEIAIAIP